MNITNKDEWKEYVIMISILYLVLIPWTLKNSYMLKIFVFFVNVLIVRQPVVLIFTIKQPVRKKQFSFYAIYYDHFSGTLDKEEFIEAFESILDHIQYRNQLEKLFDKVFK